MYEYEICTVPDEEIFHKQCTALEKNITGLEKGKLLQDVDSSLIQPYQLQGEGLKVVNDVMLGVYIESEFDITSYFTSTS